MLLLWYVSTKNKLQERASSSQSLLLSFRPKLVTLCEFKGGWKWSVLGLLQAPVLQLVATQESLFHWKNNSFPHPPHFILESFHLHPWMDLLCHRWILRRGMGWGGLARKRSQAVHVEGLSHVALLKVKLLWGDWTVWTQGVVCHLTSFLASFDELLNDLGKIFLLLRPLLCKQVPLGDDSVCPDLQRSPLQVPEGWFSRGVIFTFLWMINVSVHQVFSRS